MNIISGRALHDPRFPLRVIGGDPGSTTGLVEVEFRQRRDNGAPIWSGARLIGAATVSVPNEIAGATDAEYDIMFRREVISTLKRFDPSNGVVDIAALEEPLDGGQVYAAKRAQGQRQTGNTPIEARGTSFRIGAYYGALLAAVTAQSRPNRVISFPVKTFHDRRGWMSSKRPNTLLACEALLKTIARPDQVDAIRRPRTRKIPDDILMALGVINHLVEYYLDYFPRPA